MERGLVLVEGVELGGDEECEDGEHAEAAEFADFVQVVKIGDEGQGQGGEEGKTNEVGRGRLDGEGRGDGAEQDSKEDDISDGSRYLGRILMIDVLLSIKNKRNQRSL